jgi:hypothetical protein
VLGLGVEGGGALAGDLADEFQDSVDVGLGSPEREIDDLGGELCGDVGKTLAVLEPCAETVLVQGREVWDFGKHE